MPTSPYLTLNTLKDKIKQLFQNILFTESELDIFINFLADEFAFNMPYLKAIYIPSDSSQPFFYDYTQSSSMVYIAIDKIDPEDGVSDIIGYISTKSKWIKTLQYYINSTDYQNQISYASFNEAIAIRLFIEYSDVLGSPYNLIKPNIFAIKDTTNVYSYEIEVITIPKSALPCILFYYSPRFLNKDYAKPIPPNIYSIFEAFAIAKFIDYVYLENIEQTTNAMVEFYNHLQGQMNRFFDSSDSTSITYMRNISIGEISIGFDTKTSIYNQLSSIIGRIAEVPGRIAAQNFKILERMKNEYQTKYKRKRFLYYTGQLNYSF